MALFIFDFDYTIANGHTHNTIVEKIRAERKACNGKSATATDAEAQWELVKSIPPIHSERLIETMNKMLADGHQIAIASFSAYGDRIIPRYLREVVKLPADLLKQILIVSWLPENHTQADKNTHIDQVIKHYNYDTSYKASIALIDDSSANLFAAYEKGYTVIEAERDGSHYQNIDYFLQAVKPGENYDFFRHKQDMEPRSLNYTRVIKETYGRLEIEEKSDNEKISPRKPS